MLESIITLIIATAVLLGSPGPATLSLAAVGASFGVSRGLPYLAGILLGLMVAMAGAILGVATLFSRWPEAKLITQLLGAAYLLYVSYRIATAPILVAGENEQADIPGLRDGFILNILNPKAYAAFFVLFSQFLVPFEGAKLRYAVTYIIIFAVAILVDSLWLLIGSGIRSVFASRKYARSVRVLFALSIVVATLWTLANS
jgi:threonine/homoserine/homoserine lactone efflux protein